MANIATITPPVVNEVCCIHTPVSYAFRQALRSAGVALAMEETGYAALRDPQTDEAGLPALVQAVERAWDAFEEASLAVEQAPLQRQNDVPLQQAAQLWVDALEDPDDIPLQQLQKLARHYIASAEQGAVDQLISRLLGEAAFQSAAMAKLQRFQRLLTYGMLPRRRR